jgi:hypothetical protein
LGRPPNTKPCRRQKGPSWKCLPALHGAGLACPLLPAQGREACSGAVPARLDVKDKENSKWLKHVTDQRHVTDLGASIGGINPFGEPKPQVASSNGGGWGGGVGVEWGVEGGMMIWGGQANSSSSVVI